MEQPDQQVRASPIESAAHATSLPGGDSGDASGVILVTRAAKALLQRYLDVFLGAVLVLAGALKAQQLLIDASAGRASDFPRELLIGASAFELAFGCWLLGGLHRRLTRWLALSWFTSLAAVALAQAMGGAPSCACFGELHTDPWLMFAFDVAAVVALWIWGPIASSSARLLPVVLFLSLLPATGLISLAAVPSYEPMFAQIDLGDIAQGEQKQQTFQCRNDSGASMDVAATETSCPCASIHLEQTGILAGQLLTGRVTLDLRSKPRYTGDVVIEAKGLTRRGQLAFVLVIRARVYPVPQANKDTL